MGRQRGARRLDDRRLASAALTSAAGHPVKAVKAHWHSPSPAAGAERPSSPDPCKTGETSRGFCQVREIVLSHAANEVLSFFLSANIAK
jgi:hypothetical protein